MMYICEDVDSCINKKCNHYKQHLYDPFHCKKGSCVFRVNKKVECITVDEYNKRNEFFNKEEFEI